MREIPLTQGYVALVDDADYAALSQWKWCYGAGGYAIRGVRIDGRKRSVKMHRQLLGLPVEYDGDTEGDHMNGNRLDNRRRNLRVVSLAFNRQNRRVKRTSTTGVRGVSRVRNVNRECYYVRVKTGGKTYCLGTYETLEAAAEAARLGRLRLLPGALR